MVYSVTPTTTRRPALVSLVRTTRTKIKTSQLVDVRSNADVSSTYNDGHAVFGAAQNNSQQQPATGGLFGQNNATGTGGLFGQINQNQQQGQTNAFGGGGLFGAAAKPAAPAGGGLFGSTANNAGGGLFGQNNANANAGTQPAGGLFGNSTLGQNNAQPANAFGGGGLFGAKPPAPAQPAGGLGTSTFGLGQSTLTASQLGGAPPVPFFFFSFRFCRFSSASLASSIASRSLIDGTADDSSGARRATYKKHSASGTRSTKNLRHARLSLASRTSCHPSPLGALRQAQAQGAAPFCHARPHGSRCRQRGARRLPTRAAAQLRRQSRELCQYRRGRGRDGG